MGICRSAALTLRIRGGITEETFVAWFAQDQGVRVLCEEETHLLQSVDHGHVVTLRYFGKLHCARGRPEPLRLKIT
jgi:hypothetical protein